MDLIRLGNILRERREALHMPRADVAARVQMSPAYIYLIEEAKPRNGGRPSQPRRPVLERWAQALGLDAAATRQLLILAGREAGPINDEHLHDLQHVTGEDFLPPSLQEPLLLEDVSTVLQQVRARGEWDAQIPILRRAVDVLRRASTPLLPRYARAVTCWPSTTPLIAPLREMAEQMYSQVVVRHEGRLTLLTSEGVTGWVAARSAQGPVDANTAVISDALSFDEPVYGMVMAGEDTVEAAHQVLYDPVRLGRPRLYAVIITEHGRSDEKPLGMVTPWDLLAWDSHA